MGPRSVTRTGICACTRPPRCSPPRDPGFVDTLRGRVRTTASLVEWLGVPTFVSTLDLIDYVPDATWLPVTVDVDAPGVDCPVPSAPARSSSTLRAIVRSGLSGHRPGAHPARPRRRYPLPRPLTLAHDDLIAAIASADIVVDRLGLGLYGVLACEAMGAGRLVVAEVGDRIRTRMAPASVPILEITATSVEDVLRRTLADRVEGRALAGWASPSSGSSMTAARPRPRSKASSVMGRVLVSPGSVTVIVPTRHRTEYVRVAVLSILASAAELAPSRPRYAPVFSSATTLPRPTTRRELARRLGVDYARVLEHDGRADPGAAIALG